MEQVQAEVRKQLAVAEFVTKDVVTRLQAQIDDLRSQLPGPAGRPAKKATKATAATQGSGEEEGRGQEDGCEEGPGEEEGGRQEDGGQEVRLVALGHVDEHAAPPRR